VLYPNDGNRGGRRLRLKQQHFFVSCSLQELLAQPILRQLPSAKYSRQWAVQLNDTHPSIAVAEADAAAARS